MTFGTATIVLGIVYFAIVSGGFRRFMLGVVAIAAGLIAAVIANGQDKPQTLFYNFHKHPAYLMRNGDVCQPDWHIWNGWCVK